MIVQLEWSQVQFFHVMTSIVACIQSSMGKQMTFQWPCPQSSRKLKFLCDETNSVRIEHLQWSQVEGNMKDLSMS